jgi:hypothetical protein
VFHQHLCEMGLDVSDGEVLSLYASRIGSGIDFK